MRRETARVECGHDVRTLRREIANATDWQNHTILGFNQGNPHEENEPERRARVEGIRRRAYLRNNRLNRSAIPQRD